MNRRFDSFHMGFEQFDALFYNMFNFCIADKQGVCR